jgi:nitric oxide reductase activation protein
MMIKMMMTIMMPMTMMIILHNLKTTKKEVKSEIENLHDNYVNHFNAQKHHICKKLQETFVHLQFLFNLQV